MRRSFFQMAYTEFFQFWTQFLSYQPLRNLTFFAFILDASSSYYQIQKKHKEEFLEENKRENCRKPDMSLSWWKMEKIKKSFP